MRVIDGLSPEQREVVELPLAPLAVTACAGSGKTLTAIHRLAAMRSAFDDDHGLIALLSFSNVAVETFRAGYHDLMRAEGGHRRSMAVEIDTVDAFITCNVLRPHGHRTMNASRTPFLVEGGEAFLSSFKVYDGSISHPIRDLRARVNGPDFRFEVGRGSKFVPPGNAKASIEKLGKSGAYTHDLGRYWVLRTLREQPDILRAFTRRYPHILVDEAQDISAEHQAILELLASKGCQLSLIGDVNQGIYDFSGADGKFLNNYHGTAGVTARRLTVNYRSIPTIVKVANALAGTNDVAHREAPDGFSGPHFITFKKGEEDKAIAAFASLCDRAKIDPKDAAIVCRSVDWSETWSGADSDQGQGVVRTFANAVLQRERQRRMGDAYNSCCVAIAGLLTDDQHDCLMHMKRPLDEHYRGIRRLIWDFVRDSDTGLPSGSLKALSEWHPLLVDRCKQLLQALSQDFGLTFCATVGQRLAKKALKDSPLVIAPDLAAVHVPRFRVTTVHKVKGESIGAVLYAADKKHVRALLDGTKEELGRIGYVAATRARDLLVLAIPESVTKELEADLLKAGFQRASATVSVNAPRGPTDPIAKDAINTSGMLIDFLEKD